MDYGAIIGMVGQLAGAAAGQAASSMQQSEVMRLIKSVSDEFGKINVPQLQKLLLEKAPETKLAGIRDDPTYRAQQNAADAQLNDVVQSGGLTLADRASLNAIRNRLARGESAGRDAITNSLAARGSLDSGAQLAAELQGNQQSAQSAAEAGAQTAGAAQARAYQAIRDRARNAGEGLDRSYRQQSDAAKAADAINAGNTAIANTAARYNAGLGQQNFDNQLRLTGARTAPAYALAGANAAQAKDTQQAWQGAGNIVGAAGKSTYDSYKSGQQSNTGGAPATPPIQESEDQWNQYPGASGAALSGESTRPQRKVVAHRLDGSPVYEEELR